MRRRLTVDQRDHVRATFEEYRGYVEAVATQHVGAEHAPDVVGEVGLRLCRSLNGLREPSAVRAWVYRVTVSAARDHYRKQERLERTREHLAATSSEYEAVVDPDVEVARAQQRSDFYKALDRLKGSEKTAIRNALLGSVVFGGTERVALTRAKARLRTILNPRARR